MENNLDNLNWVGHFMSPVYNVSRPDLLDSVNKVFVKYLTKAKKERKTTEVWPLYHTDAIPFDTNDEIGELYAYIAKTSWHILQFQGYEMNNHETFIQDFWGQSLNKHAGQPEHVHPGFAQISGFYFIDVPENSTALTLFDPRPGKRQINMMEIQNEQLNMCTERVNVVPKPGDLYLCPAWLPHGFMPNASSKPFNFIHFNVSVRYKPASSAQPTGPEII